MQPQDDRPTRPAALALIGNTPLVPIRALNPNPRVEIFAKLEKSNPGGSVKDRIALWMIEAAERSGELRPGKTILEATSGNTGIGLAMVAAIKGYPILLAMSAGVSLERRKILAAFGAQFLLTPADRGTDGAIERAYELAQAEPDRFYLADQYNNPANVGAHYETTAPEIWTQTQGRITHFVATIGTTGTLMGCGKRLRELNPTLRVVGVEPFLGHKLQGLKNLKEAYLPGIYDAAALDEKVNIEDEAAWEMTRRLAKDEGLLVGMSSGAAMHAAAELARRLESGVIVAIFPDGGERYLSTPLFQVAEPESLPVKLQFFNTLSRSHEPFEPIAGDKQATLYSCGPTVHRRPHLGILRRSVVADLVVRALELAGYEVKHVASISDIDDLTLAEAERSGEPLADLCRRHEEEFHADLQALGVKPAQAYARSSEHVPEMIALAKTLVDRGFAYERHNSVYFDISRVQSYGELSGKDLGKIKIGATVDLDRYDKADPRDFTLFRRSTLAEMRKGMSFKTDWGNVRPSLHVQCSAMARALLGPSFDIHLGSVDLIFPHNENEIAQSRALAGNPLVRLWLHSELVLVGNKKMTYEEDACVTLPDLLARGFSAREVRFFLLQTHYRQPVHLADDRLAASQASLRRLDQMVARLADAPAGSGVADVRSWTTGMVSAFSAAIFDDLNISAALAALFGLVKQINQLATEQRLSREDVADVRSALAIVDKVLGVLALPGEESRIPDDVMDLVRRREVERKNRDYVQADALRDQIAARGFVVQDMPDGPRVTRKA
jgi:cysteinyl-tRNA synthetase